jgi:prepilin-type N-terminal cleavage/methylation domain-containing protein
VIDRPARGERGVTLVELMVALLINGIFMVFVLGIYGQMSSAYRGQTTISEVQQSLQSARETILPELKQAGLGLPDGFRAQGNNVTTIPALSVVNNADGSGPDLIRFYFADPTAQARVISILDPNRQFATVDFVDTFAVGNVAVLVNPRMIGAPVGGGSADIAQFDACVVRVPAVDAATNTISFSATSADYNTADNVHCTEVQNATNSEGAASETMMYRFVGRSYRIDPTRKALSVLQMSPSGELLANDWADQGVGFTDLQIASRYSEEADAQDLDADLDPTRDWYSGEAQETPDLTVTRPANAVLTQLSVSFTARTQFEMDILPSAQAPGFGDPTSIQTLNHNRLGDRQAVQLLGVADASRPPEHQGDFVYRFSSTTVDVRNLGIGR